MKGQVLHRARAHLKVPGWSLVWNELLNKKLPIFLSRSKRSRDWYYLFATSTISFKRDKNIGNFLVKSSFQTNDQPGTFKCARARCKACPFIHNANKISGPKRSIKTTDHFTCTSAKVIYCITCTYCKKIYIGETERRP